MQCNYCCPNKYGHLGKIAATTSDFFCQAKGKEFPSNERYNFRFPKDLDISVKATLLGAALLIDFSFFENTL